MQSAASGDNRPEPVILEGWKREHEQKGNILIKHTQRRFQGLLPLAVTSALLLLLALSFMPGVVARAASILVAVLGFASLRGLLVRPNEAERSIQVVKTRPSEQHEHVVLIDKPTGLGNERSFELELERTVKQAQRHANTVALSLVEVDAYDSIRAEYGETVAERMMAELAGFMGGRRADDRTFRLSGGHFAIILPYTTAPEIYPLMEHLRSETERSELGTTVTIGTAHVAPRMDSVELLHRAKQALTEAHVTGGNTVVTFDPARVSEQLAPIASPA